MDLNILCRSIHFLIYIQWLQQRYTWLVRNNVESPISFTFIAIENGLIDLCQSESNTLYSVCASLHNWRHVCLEINGGSKQVKMKHLYLLDSDKFAARCDA